MNHFLDCIHLCQCSETLQLNYVCHFRQEAPLQVPDMSIAADNKVQGKRQIHKDVEATVPKKKKKKEKQLKVSMLAAVDLFIY